MSEQGPMSKVSFGKSSKKVTISKSKGTRIARAAFLLSFDFERESRPDRPCPQTGELQARFGDIGTGDGGCSFWRNHGLDPFVPVRNLSAFVFNARGSLYAIQIIGFASKDKAGIFWRIQGDMSRRAIGANHRLGCHHWRPLARRFARGEGEREEKRGDDESCGHASMIGRACRLPK